jgi:transposase-like protein
MEKNQPWHDDFAALKLVGARRYLHAHQIASNHRLEFFTKAFEYIQAKTQLSGLHQ